MGAGLSGHSPVGACPAGLPQRAQNHTTSQIPISVLANGPSWDTALPGGRARSALRIGVTRSASESVGTLWGICSNEPYPAQVEMDPKSATSLQTRRIRDPRFRSHNPEVGGSNPSPATTQALGTSRFRGLRCFRRLPRCGDFAARRERRSAGTSYACLLLALPLLALRPQRGQRVTQPRPCNDPAQGGSQGGLLK